MDCAKRNHPHAIAENAAPRAQINEVREGRTMMKAPTLVFACLALVVASAAQAQSPIELKFSRVVDLTLPIHSNMPAISGIRSYSDNPFCANLHNVVTNAQ